MQRGDGEKRRPGSNQRIVSLSMVRATPEASAISHRAVARPPSVGSWREVGLSVYLKAPILRDS